MNLQRWLSHFRMASGYIEGASLLRRLPWNMWYYDNREYGAMNPYQWEVS